jgi:hypothetical protein
MSFPHARMPLARLAFRDLSVRDSLIHERIEHGGHVRLLRTMRFLFCVGGDVLCASSAESQDFR